MSYDNKSESRCYYMVKKSSTSGGMVTNAQVDQ